MNKVLKKLDTHIEAFRAESGISCVQGCGKCCFNPGVNASPLEFLPIAYDLMLKGHAELLYEQIESSEEETICVFARKFVTDQDGGYCSIYDKRGMVCRLFGFSAFRNKMGELSLIACKLIKENHDTSLGRYKKSMIPVSSDFYFLLRNIDTDLGLKLMPINKAIKEALSIVLNYYSYRRKPRRRSA